MPQPPIRVGLVGTGYLGKAFALGYMSAPVVCGPGLGPVELASVAASTPERSVAAARDLGFSRPARDWREIVEDANIDIVVVNTPNHLHAPISLAAISAGKHVHCEKPLGLDAAEAKAMADAAERAGVRTMVGFNYHKNPAQRLAREIIRGGEIGTVYSVRATHNEDYMSDPAIPLGWRFSRAIAGHGALGDVGSHVFHMIEYLVAPIEAVMGELRTVIDRRPLTVGSTETGPVENDDEVRAIMRLGGGIRALVEASRVATGRKMLLSYEITGTKGALHFTQERMSELKLYLAQGDGRDGFRIMPLSPGHPGVDDFGIGPGHGLGFNDQKTIECADLLRAIREDRPAYPDFRAAARINAVMDAVALSSREGRWVEVRP